MPEPSTKTDAFPAVVNDDEPDDWWGSPVPENAMGLRLTALDRDKRIFSTGCSVESTKMNDCYFEKKDWRLCKVEVRFFAQPVISGRSAALKALLGIVSRNGTDTIALQMDAFRECWKRRGNDQRTDTKHT